MKRTTLIIGLMLGLILLGASAVSADVPMGEIIKPAERDVKWSDAKCNDGTAFTFALHAQPPNNTELVIYLSGGGYCDDDSWYCDDRADDPAYASLMTTHPLDDGDPVPFNGNGIFSHTAGVNPTFYDSNMVYAFYCSSDMWSGGGTGTHETSEGDLYFNGRTNLTSMMEWLDENTMLDDDNSNTTVIIAGGSAGGVGVTVIADIIDDMFPNMVSRGQFRLLSDGAFINLFDDEDFRPGEAFETPSEYPFYQVVTNAYDFWGSALNPDCESDASPDEGKCFIGFVVYHSIVDDPPDGLGIPLFFQTASADSWVMGFHGISLTDPAHDDEREAYRDSTLYIFDNIDTPWLYSFGGVFYHTSIHADSAWGYGPPLGSTMQEMVTDFWDEEDPYWQVWGNPE